jgi:HSP20 family protein
MIMLVRFAPFNELARLQAEMDRLFDGRVVETPKPVAADGARAAWNPSVDVTEDPEKISIQADLPGVEQSSLEIQIDQNVLTLKGDRKLERSAEASRELYRRYERVAGTFARQFRLPPTVDAEKISAALKDGVLTLTLPKRPEAQPRQIKVAVQ